MADEENHFEQRLTLLRRHRRSIIADLDVQDVIPELLEHLILLHDDKQRIDAEKTLEDKANELINILERKTLVHKNKEALPVFVGALKLKYPWLHEKLALDDPNFKVLGSQEKLIQQVTPAWPLQKKLSKSKLEAGGVPCLPIFAVERKDILQNIFSELQGLKRNHYLVLHGMAGCGKSVLAIQACNSLFSITNGSKAIEDGIFWLSIGKECSEAKDAILAKMRILCERLDETRAPNSLEHGAELLRTAFIKRSSAILILDDVWRPEVIRAFDVGCRTLCTTRDLSVTDVVQGRTKSLKVSDGFTETESMQLFRQAVGVQENNELPDVARSIHFECKGSPMVISLISALLQDHESPDHGRWEYYLDALSKRKYSQMRRSREYEHESIIDAIALSVESLNEKMRNYYSDFALFQDDVGIPCGVLMVLWGLGKYEVEDIMTDLVRKNLAVDEFDPQRKCTIYNVHDLQLDYLKHHLHNEEGAEKRLHSKLIDSYMRASDYKFHKLPDDGYIHFHLGYHLYRASRYEDFPRAYLNFLFIGEKIRITGPADLLVDLRKYQDFIFGNDFDERSAYIDELKSFAQLIGHRLYGQMDVDVVQLGLQTPKLSRIYDKARKEANSTPHRLYLEWKNASGSEWKNPESTVLCSDNVRCVKFVGSEGKHFLAALNNGCIELCDLDSSTVCHRFSGHRSAVQSIDVYENHGNPFIEDDRESRFIFLSSSEDKTCKLWDLRVVFGNIESRTNDMNHGSSPSPKLRPDHWTFDKPRDDSFMTFGFHTAPLTYAEFSRDGSKVVSTSTNEIMVWSSISGQVLSKISLHSSSATSAQAIAFQTCYFSYDESGHCLPYLLSSAENQLVLFSTDTPSIFSAVEGHHMRIVSVLQLAPFSFCTVSENEIGLWRVADGKTPPRSRSLSPRKSYSFAVSNGESPVSTTRADALTIPPNQERGGGLRPTDFRNVLKAMVNSSEDSSGRKSPTLSSDCYSPTTVSTFLDTGTNFVKIWREEVLPRKSTGLFQCAAVSRDELLACGTSERKIILWQLSERQYLGEFSSHNGWLRSLDFSAVDHLTLLSGSEDHTVMVWDVAEEHKGRKEPLKKMFFSSVFVHTPDELLSTGYFVSSFVTDINTIQIFRDSKRCMDSVPLSCPITAVVLSSCGSNAIVGCKDGKILRLKDLKASLRRSPAKVESQGHTPATDAGFELVGSLEGSVKFLKFNSNGLYLIAVSISGNLTIFKGFHFHRSIKSYCDIINCHFLFDDYLAVIAIQDAILTIQHVDNGLELQGYQSNDITGVTCSVKKVDSSAVVIGTSQDGVLMLTIEESTGVIKASVINCRHNTAVRSLAFSSDGLIIAIGHDSGLITVWNVYGGVFSEEAGLLLHKSSVRYLLFSPMFVGGGRWLASCGDRLAFWSLAKHEDKIHKPSFMEERRRKKSGESRPSSRLSLELSDGIKVGRQGKRELLQSFCFHGSCAEIVVSNSYFSEFLTVDDNGILYFVETLKGSMNN